MKIQVTQKEMKIIDDIDVYVWTSEVLRLIIEKYKAWDLYINSDNLDLKHKNSTFC